jgi:hypothetical protein
MGMKDELVIAGRFLKLEEAEVGQGLLQSEGIQSFVADDLLPNVHPGFSGASGGVRLMVHQADLPRAQKVLANVGGSISLPDNFEPPADDEPAPEFPKEGTSTFVLAFIKGGAIAAGIFALLAFVLMMMGFGRGILPSALVFFFFLGGLLGLFCLPGKRQSKN